MNRYVGLEEILDKDKIRYNEDMKKHITMKVGGPADCLVLPSNVSEIINVIDFAKKNNIEYFVIGNGSNLLVKDDGITGLVIKINSKFCDVNVEGNKIIACSGIGMPALSQIAKKNGLTGLEFACGIPGTIGGGVRMNAGAYGSEISNVLEEVKYLDEDSNICIMKKEDMKFGYRHSIFMERNKCVILEATFMLSKQIQEKICESMKENRNARLEKQPLEYPNFGSVFKRPEGYFVGKLVSDSGLRGKMIGGAQVSEKHTGFIVNRGNATCKDVLDLIRFVQDTVFEKFNVGLQTEVEIIGGKNK